MAVQKSKIGKAVNDTVGFLKEVYEASKIVGLAAAAGATVGGTMHESAEGAVIGGALVGGLVVVQKVFFARGLRKDDRKVAPVEIEDEEPVFEPLPNQVEILNEIQHEIVEVATHHADRYRHIDIRWKNPIQSESEMANRTKAASIALEHVNNSGLDTHDAEAYLDRVSAFDEKRLATFVQFAHDLKKDAVAKWAEKEPTKEDKARFKSYEDVEDLLLTCRL